ncbi:MAG: DUF3108 domain-containing protein [Bacteroidetes bacterium]|nr:DUF3108 domain-containing protein [Bacteroidota bacterium]
MIFFITLVFLLAGSGNLISQASLVGENCSYTLRVLSIPAATITLAVQDTGRIDGRTVYTIKATARTNSFFSKFYALENTYFTTVDDESGLPLVYIKDIRQKTIEQHMEVHYAPQAKTADYSGDKFEGRHIETLSNAHNLFSMIFKLRRQQLEVGQRLSLNLDIETEPWKALVTVEGRETIRVMGTDVKANRVSFVFNSLLPEKKRKKTDILTRRLVRSNTKLLFWIGVNPPYTFLRVDVDTSPFTTVTELDSKIP